MNDKQKVYKIINTLIFFLTIAAIFLLRFTTLLQTSHPTGLDGYYYALQAKSFALTGKLENPDYETGYYICGIFAWIFRNPIIACKIWAALTSTLISVSIFILVNNISKDKKLAFLALILSSFLSPSLAIFEINYINNQTGLMFFFFYASAFYKLINDLKLLTKRKRILYSVLSILLFILSCMSHLVATAYCFIFTIVILAQKLSVKKQLILVITGIAAFILLFISQIGRFKSVFSLTPVFPVFSEHFKNRIGISVCLEMTIYFILSYISSIVYFIKTKKFSLYLLLPVILFFPFWKLDSLDMGYRMLLNAVPCGICFSLLMLKKAFPEIQKSNNLFFSILCLILMPFGLLSSKAYNPKKDPPYEYYKSIATKVHLPDNSLLIAHLGLNHCYTYYMDLKDCLNYYCDYDVPDNEVWRLACGVNAEYLKQFFGEYSDDELNRLIVQIDSDYVLIKEDLWLRYLSYEEDDIVDALQNWYNPHEYRPSFIRKK